MTDGSSSTPTSEAATEGAVGGEASPIAERVAQIRQRAESDPDGAREEAWTWIEGCRERAASDHAAVEGELSELYRLGIPPTALDGPTDGILVATTTNPVVDRAVKAITDQWMPWQGKRFDAATSTGDNRMTEESELPAKALKPTYAMKEGDGGKLAYDFKTYVAAGVDDPDIQVMVIDYADIEENPAIIRQIRDELVEVVPGAYLGKILFKLPREKYGLVGFFALTHAV